MGRGDALSKRIAALRRQDEHARRQNNLREKRRLDKEREAQRGIPLLKRYRHTNWYRVTKWSLSSLGGLAALIASIYTFAGPIWPTNPEIHPHDVLNGTSFILPFTVKNKSILFDIRNAEFTCGVDWLYYRAAPTTGTLAPMAFASGTFSIPTADTINYECDASQLLKTQEDGSLKLGGITFPGQVRAYPPLIVRKMCLWIKVDYKILGFIPRHFTSGIFQWPASRDVAQWLDGPTLQPNQITMDEWLLQGQTAPPDVVGCSAEAHKPQIVFDKNGNATILAGKPTK
jgi:hypothetical protein